jgi:hypothetical protein
LIYHVFIRPVIDFSLPGNKKMCQAKNVSSWGPCPPEAQKLIVVIEFNPGFCYYLQHEKEENYEII